MNFDRTSCILAALLCSIFLAACTQSPETTVEKFYQALKDGKVDQAKNFISHQFISLMGEQNTRNMITAKAKTIEQCGGIKSFNVELNGDDNFRKGAVHLEYKGSCKSVQHQTIVTNENGNWKIGAK